jgi:AsmA protein
MQSHPPHKPPPLRPQAKPHPAPAAGRLAQLMRNRRARLALIAGGTVVGLAVLALIAVNLLISADWVRDRIAARIKEQTGRELTVNGATALFFAPGPRVIISDAVISDPEQRAGTSDIALDRLVLDLSFMQLLSRNVDAKRVVLQRPVVTVRLGDNDAERPKKPRSDKAKADNPGDKPRREVKLDDIRIEDGTVNIVYDEKGTERRIEHIAANLSLPSRAAPLTGTGKFDWKDQTVNFSFALTSLAELRESHPAKLVLSLDTQAIAARFDGQMTTRPEFAGEGELSAKAHSIPSLLAWMREKPAASGAIGDGELASHVAWTKDEISFKQSRFALQHASGQGQAVVVLKSPRPHIRAAFALDYLDLNPFLASNGKPAPAQQDKAQQAGRTAPKTAPSAQTPGDWFSKPGEDQSESVAAPPPPAEPDAAMNPTPPVSPAPAAEPASFDADVNLNVRKTRYAHLELGPASLGLAFRNGILNATLGGMELYQGHAVGKLVLDAAKPVPEFSGDFRLDGVQARPFLSDAAQFSLLEGETKLTLQVSGAGSNAEEVKSSLQGQGSLAVSDGAIEGINLTEMISQLGEGQIPEMRQGRGAKTVFSDLGGSFTVKNGVAETSNIQMTSPLLKVTATGNVDLTQNTIDMLAESEIVAGPEGANGANDLAGLSLPVRIEGPLDRPAMRPELKAMFASPDKTGKTINKIGKALEKKFKGKPVGEAIGRILGNVQIGSPEDEKEAAPQSNRQRSGRKNLPQAAPAPEPEEESAEPEDPDIERILR